MLKTRLGSNAMRHFWRQLSGSSIDLDHVRRPVADREHRQRDRAIGLRCNPQSGIARIVGRSDAVAPAVGRSSMEKHDIANHTEAEDCRREPDGFDEVCSFWAKWHVPTR